MENIKEVIFEAKPSNSGFQVLILKEDEKFHLIMRNMSKSKEPKKYKITIQEID